MQHTPRASGSGQKLFGGKKHYQRPQLQVYGALSKLTAALKTGSVADFITGRMMAG